MAGYVGVKSLLNAVPDAKISTPKPRTVTSSRGMAEAQWRRNDMTDDTRTCKVCGEVKPIDQFHSGLASSGVRYWKHDCLTCAGTEKRTRYHSDPEYRALQNMYSMEAGVKRKYPGSWAGSVAREGAKKLLEAKCCSYCQMPNDGSQPFSLDHHLPLALGGAHALENLRPCCEPCNRAKHDMPPAVFKAWMDALVFRLAWMRAQ